MTSSLARLLPSALTEDEICRRRHELEPQLARKHRVVVIRRDDPDLTGMDRLLFDRLMQARFGIG